MYKTIDKEYSKELDETTYMTTLSNGLQVYICKREGFSKKMGLFGTKYGSVTNDFVDVTTGKRVHVPDGIAHFLEHKLFEKEGANALDLFSKMGVSSNAYTSFDQTVFYFETVEKFEESIKMLIKLIREPYFTRENVKKEQGIIGQEISMYDDDQSFKVYLNVLEAMYNVNPVKIDIAGTIESISKITPELLYTCYDTFYNPQNMFLVVVGDVDVEKTIKLIDNEMKKYKTKKIKSLITYSEVEPIDISKKEITQKMDIYLPSLCIGYKLELCSPEEVVKNACVSDIISDMYFSKLSSFYETEYKKGYINDTVDFVYEGSATFSHLLILATSTNIDELEEDIIEYIKKIKNENIDKELFETIKRKKIGENILSSDSISNSYRRIIDAVVNKTGIYYDVEVYNTITEEDIKEFLNKLEETYRVTSKVIPK